MSSHTKRLVGMHHRPLPLKLFSNDKITKSNWLILTVLSLVGLSTMYTETMVFPAITDFITEFNTSHSNSSLILTAYLITGAVMTPIAGKLSDVYGRKRILLIVMTIYIIGTFAGGLHNYRIER
jgi:MFS family permease